MTRKVSKRLEIGKKRRINRFRVKERERKAGERLVVKLHIDLTVPL